jgi:Protein of unknown function (DUF3631)
MENHSPDSQKTTDMLDSIASFFRQYLVCDDHQLTVLTLWTVHTWCFQPFSTTPYLDIRSPQPQSGKTRCLRILNALCSASAFAAGAPPKTLMERLLLGRSTKALFGNNDYAPIPKPHTFLLDDCHHTFGPSERQPLLALLNSGSDRGCVYPYGGYDYYVFGPKAFAANAPLPQSLAARCIPIVLQRPRPSDTRVRFQIEDGQTREFLAGMKDQLKAWSEDHIFLLKQAAQNPPAQLPSGLTPRQRDCAEPLLHIADIVAGPWPQKARIALAALFQLSDCDSSALLLSDIRSIFQQKDNPDSLPTRDLLPALSSLDSRPWSAWTGKSGRSLGALLRPFGISSDTLHYGSEPTCKGYRREDFQDAWERYLPPLTIPAAHEESSSISEMELVGSGTKIPSGTASGTIISAIDAG